MLNISLVLLMYALQQFGASIIRTSFSIFHLLSALPVHWNHELIMPLERLANISWAFYTNLIQSNFERIPVFSFVTWAISLFHISFLCNTLKEMRWIEEKKKRIKFEFDEATNIEKTMCNYYSFAISSQIVLACEMNDGYSDPTQTEIKFSNESHKPYVHFIWYPKVKIDPQFILFARLISQF